MSDERDNNNNKMNNFIGAAEREYLLFVFVDTFVHIWVLY